MVYKVRKVLHFVFGGEVLCGLYRFYLLIKLKVRMKKLFLVFLLCLPLFGWAVKEEDVKVLKKGDLCPGFVFRNVEGKEVSLEQFKGKYVVIDVWASWCQPCKQEFPYLKKLEDKYKDKNIVFVIISSDAQERRWHFELGFLREKLTLQWWIAGNKRFISAFEIATLPRMILLYPEGRIADLKLPKPSDPKFEKVLKKLKGL